jgi:hypothetical protein
MEFHRLRALAACRGSNRTANRRSPAPSLVKEFRMKKLMAALLLVLASIATVQLASSWAAEPSEKGVYLDIRKIEESEAKTKLEEPRFGYVGDLGTFVAVTKNANGHEAMAGFIVHQYPNQDRQSLGCTKLRYEGPKRLGNVDGWVFLTEWDGKAYPSKVFLSAQRVYFGGGTSEYIAADYREGTGWAWKLLPLRRVELMNKSASGGAGN